jgi:hypothetical protein
MMVSRTGCDVACTAVNALNRLMTSSCRRLDQVPARRSGRGEVSERQPHRVLLVGQALCGREPGTDRRHEREAGVHRAEQFLAADHGQRHAEHHGVPQDFHHHRHAAAPVHAGGATSACFLPGRAARWHRRHHCMNVRVRRVLPAGHLATWPPRHLATSPPGHLAPATCDSPLATWRPATCDCDLRLCDLRLATPPATRFRLRPG